MKKNILILSSALLLGVAVFVTGCKDEEDPDITNPEVTINGPATQTISLQGTYSEQGASATDEKDGSLTPTVSGSVNVNLTGDYTITYTATDAAGNVGTATRTITVVNDAAYIAGVYTCEDAGLLNLSPWTQTITASTTKNNRVLFSKFAGKPGNSTISAILDSSKVLQVETKTSGNVTAGGSLSCPYHYEPAAGGTVVAKYTSGPNAGKYYFIINYFENQVAGPAGCVTGGQVLYFDNFLKQ